MNNKVIPSVFSYSVIQYLVMGIGFVKGIYMAKYLGPALLGTWGLIQLILEYLRYGNLGISAAMNLEVSVNMKDEKKKEYINSVINSSFTYLLLVSLIYIFFAFIVRVYFQNYIPSDIAPYIYAISFLGVFEQLRIFTVQYLRLFGKYKKINMILLVSACTLFLGVLLFVKKYKLDAVVWASIVSGSLTSLICLANLNGVKFLLNFNLIRNLILIGIILLIYNLLVQIFSSVDRLFVANFFPRGDLGYYTLSNTIAISTMVILTSFTYLYYPHFLNKLNIKNKKEFAGEDIYKLIRQYTSMLAVPILGVGIMGLLFIGPFINYFLPQYTQSIIVYKFLILGIMFYKLAYFTEIFLISNKYYSTLTIFLAGVTLLAVAMDLIVVRKNWGIKGIAITTFIAFIIYGVGSAWLAFTRLKKHNLKGIIHLYNKTLIFIPVVALVVFYRASSVWIGLPLFCIIYLSDIKKTVKLFRTRFDFDAVLK